MTHLCRYCLVLAVAGVMPFLALWAANTKEEKKGFFKKFFSKS